jgi:glycine/D-amino acid oxidase-like deaminating enzyme
LIPPPLAHPAIAAVTTPALIRATTVHRVIRIELLLAPDCVRTALRPAPAVGQPSASNYTPGERRVASTAARRISLISQRPERIFSHLPTYRTPQMTDDWITPPPLPRRDFLKVAGAGAGLLMVGGATPAIAAPVPGLSRKRSIPSASASPDVVVIGAGAWGSFTAMNLRKMGARVTLVDAYGPGNGRSTSGDETRGVRSSYGDKPGKLGELWMLWARESMKRWIAFDDEWGKHFRLNLFHTTGDLIMRTEWDNFQLRTKVWWEKNKIPFQVLKPDDVRKAFPVIQTDDITAILYEPDAGVVRARRAAQAAAAAFETLGGKLVIGRATPSKIAEGRLQEVTLDTGATLRADTFVFTVGPWLGKTFPDILAKKTRVPIGYVCYFATPVNDHRFTYPNLPSYNFPGVTGWVALPVDNRGFRVRGTERLPGDTAGGRGGAGGVNAPGATPAAGNAPGAGRGGANAAADTTRAGRGGGRGGGAPGAGGGGGRGGAQPDVPPAQQDPDTSDRWADAERIAGSRRFVAHRFPILKDAPLAQTHACHYESTSSGNFIIDKHPQMANAWIVAGGNAEGFKFSPVIGEYAAQRVLGTEGDPVIAKGFRIPEKEYDPPPAPADSTRRVPPP